MYSELDFDLWSSWIGKGAINCERILAVIVVEMVFFIFTNAQHGGHNSFAIIPNCPIHENWTFLPHFDICNIDLDHVIYWFSGLKYENSQKKTYRRPHGGPKSLII